MLFKKNILLISHELSATGAPKALLELARFLIKLDYNVYLASYRNGPFENEFKKCGVKILCLKKKKIKYILLFSHFFELIIYNTIVCWDYIKTKSLQNKTLWWIHEAIFFENYLNNISNSQKNKLIQKLQDTKNIYCVSEYAKNFFLKYNSDIKILEPFVKDMTNIKSYSTTNKFNITYLGEIISAKGQDIFLNYFKNLNSDLKSKIEINFIGQIVDNDFFENIKNTANIPNINFLGGLKHDKAMEKLAQCDLFALFSKGDSFSIATIEAMILDKKIMISQNVGAKHIIESENCGYVIKNENEFIEKLKLILSNSDNLTSSRKAYLKYFSKENYLNKLKNILNATISR